MARGPPKIVGTTYLFPGSAPLALISCSKKEDIKKFHLAFPTGAHRSISTCLCTVQDLDGQCSDGLQAGMCPPKGGLYSSTLSSYFADSTLAKSSTSKPTRLTTFDRWRTVSGHDFQSCRNEACLDIRTLAPAAAKAAGRNVALRHGSKPCPDTTPRSKKSVTFVQMLS
jgi:hypothetical protein